MNQNSENLEQIKQIKKSVKNFKLFVEGQNNVYEKKYCFGSFVFGRSSDGLGILDISD